MEASIRQLPASGTNISSEVHVYLYQLQLPLATGYRTSVINMLPLTRQNHTWQRYDQEHWCYVMFLYGVELVFSPGIEQSTFGGNGPCTIIARILSLQQYTTKYNFITITF